jgi:predicted nucleic acid-binding protein
VLIVDTTVWIDYFGGVQNSHTEWLDKEVARRRLGVTDLILCELLQGIRGDAQFALTREEMRRFAIFDTGGESLAVDSAMNYRTLRSRGITVRKTIDCLIASFCVREGHTLIHRDRDFDAFEEHLGLQVLHPER